MSLLQSLLQMLDVEPYNNWGNYKVDIAGREFTSIADIPTGLIEANPRLDDYTITSTMTKKQLQAFITFRLVDKLQNPYQKQQLKLTQEKIPELLFNDEFMNAFCAFLKSQTQAVAYSNLEDRIFKKFRQQGKIQQFYKIGSDLRKSNTEFRKRKGNDADKKWEKMVQIARSI